MASVVPESNYALSAAVFVSKNAQARRAQKKVFASQWLQAKPTGGKRTQEMAARKEQHITIDRSNSIDHPVGSDRDISGRFTARTAVAKELPIGPLLAYFSSAATFQLAVVPFAQIIIDLGLSAESGQLTGVSSALERARVDGGECWSAQSLAESARVALAALG